MPTLLGITFLTIEFQKKPAIFAGARLRISAALRAIRHLSTHSNIQVVSGPARSKTDENVKKYLAFIVKSEESDGFSAS